MQRSQLAPGFLLFLACLNPSQPLPQVETSEANGTPRKGLEPSFEERLLATIPADVKFVDRYVEVIGAEDFYYEFAPSFAFSADGRKVAYRAKRGGKWLMMVGNERGPEVDKVGPPVFSSVGSRIAYRAKHGGKEFVMIGDERGPEFYEVGEPKFSPDGSQVAYRAYGGGRKSFVMVGEEKGPEFDEVHNNPVFSPDGKQVAYVAKDGRGRNKRWFVMAGGRKGPEFTYVSDPVFSPDGTRVAYGTNQPWIVVGDQRLPVPDWKSGEVAEHLVFSPDGSSIAYVVAWHGFSSSKHWVVVGDKRGREVGGENVFPLFSPDGTQVAYGGGLTLVDKQGALHYFKDAWLYHGFSPDGRLAYVGMGSTWKARNNYVVVGDYRGPDFYEVGLPSFSRDSKKMAYPAREKGKWFLVAGDQKGPQFDWVGKPVFSADGSKVAYPAIQGKEIWWKVMTLP